MLHHDEKIVFVQRAASAAAAVLIVVVEVVVVVVVVVVLVVAAVLAAAAAVMVVAVRLRETEMDKRKERNRAIEWLLVSDPAPSSGSMPFRAATCAFSFKLRGND